MNPPLNLPCPLEFSEPALRSPDFHFLVKRIEDGNQDAAHDLYVHFIRGLRLFLTRQVRPERSEDLVHDIFTAVIKAIRNRQILQPEHLAGFVRTVAMRTVASEISKLRLERERSQELDERQHIGWAGTEADLMRKEDLVLADRALRSLRSRDREILICFYCKEQSPETICREMGLNAQQFRNINK